MACKKVVNIHPFFRHDHSIFEISTKKLKHMKTILLIGMPGPMEMVIIALVVLIFFGAKKIPEIARGMGKGIREFKDATKEVKKEINEGSTPSASSNEDTKV